MENEKISQAILMQQHIAACKASGQTVAAYCSGHSIKAHQYYYWQNKLQPATPGKFISIAPPLSTAPVSIDFINGTRIRFETLPPVEYIKQLMG
jgi:transposase-like protein